MSSLLLFLAFLLKNVFFGWLFRRLSPPREQPPPRYTPAPFRAPPAGLLWPGPVTWCWHQPMPLGNDLRSITHDGRRLIAVGDHGVILTSANGANWRVSDFPGEHLVGVACGDGHYLVVGGAGAILRSNDGLTCQGAAGRDASPAWWCVRPAGH